MRTRRVQVAVAVGAAVAAATMAGTAAVAGDDDDRDRDRRAISERLSGYEEVPAVSTTGTGKFRARIARDGESIAYTLRYDDLVGSVAQSHIHFGAGATNGAISVFLCTNLGNGPAGTQACPDPPAEVTGTITAADVIGPAAQGIAAGELGELLDAIRADATYVNVHTSTYPGGEIRAQLEDRHDD